MEVKEYLARFDAVLNGEITGGIYEDPHYLEYTKLNVSRVRRWMKTMALESETKSIVQSIDHPQNWILISEEWCADSAHIFPFIAAMADENPLISLDIQLRDSPPFLINQYLTNGGKSIPVLIVRDEDGNDLFVWGSRPDGAKKLMSEEKAEGIPMDIIKADLQKWYNADKGVSVQTEIANLLQHVKRPIQS